MEGKNKLTIYNHYTDQTMSIEFPSDSDVSEMKELFQTVMTFLSWDKQARLDPELEDEDYDEDEED